MSTEDNLPYFWAAYRLGELSKLHAVFQSEIDKSEFQDVIDWFISSNNLTPISFFAEIDGNLKMVGVGFFWVRGRLWQVSEIIWFSWASKRIILESYVNFVNNMRKRTYDETGLNFVILEFVEEKNKASYDHVCSYGVMRRVGTSEEIYPDTKCCIYESRSKK